MFAVTGATGHLGTKVISSLRQHVEASKIIAVARDAAKGSALGVAVRIADYKDKEALTRAFDGVDTLLLISSSSLDARRIEHANALVAAKNAAVKHVIYTSLLHGEAWGLPFAEDHLLTEKALKELGADYTILRNGWYWENNTSRIPVAAQSGALIGAAGDAKVSWASRQDFADAAVAVMTGAGHVGQTYELAGDAAHTFRDLAAEAARQIGRAVRYDNLSEADFAATLEGAGLPRPVALMVAEIEARGVAMSRLKDSSGALSKLIGRPTQTIELAVAEALRA